MPLVTLAHHNAVGLDLSLIHIYMQEATNSHEYQMKKDAQGNEYEVWTKILPIRDWEALEKEWSDANSSENPGDVAG